MEESGQRGRRVAVRDPRRGSVRIYFSVHFATVWRKTPSDPIKKKASYLCFAGHVKPRRSDKKHFRSARLQSGRSFHLINEAFHRPAKTRVLEAATSLFETLTFCAERNHRTICCAEATPPPPPPSPNPTHSSSLLCPPSRYY